MVDTATRAAWTTRRIDPPRQTATRLGTAVHWTGSPLTISSHHDCLRHLRAVEEYHVGVKGMSSLAYCQGACRHGVLIEGRGAMAQSGANGSVEANRGYGSVVALVGTTETLTDAEWDNIHAAILEAARLQAMGKPLVTHNDIRPDPTACPGPDLTAWIESGYPPPVEDDVPLSPEDIKRIWTSPVGGAPGQPGWWQALNAQLDEIRQQNAEIKAALDAMKGTP